MGMKTDSLWVIVYRWLMNNGFEYCRMCLTRENLTFEHIIPQSCQGSNSIDNISILCADCNNKKGAQYFGWLDSLTWPPPNFDTKNAADIEVGDILAKGKVLSKHFVSCKKYSVWDVVLDTEYAISSFNRKHTLMEISSAQQYLIIPEAVLTAARTNDRVMA